MRVSTKMTRHISFVRAAVAKLPGVFALWNGPDVVQVNKFRSFQMDKVRHPCKSAGADGFDKFLRPRSHGHQSGRRHPSSNCRGATIPGFQGNGTTIVHATSCPQEGLYSLPSSVCSVARSARRLVY